MVMIMNHLYNNIKNNKTICIIIVMVIIHLYNNDYHTKIIYSHLKGNKGLVLWAV